MTQEYQLIQGLQSQVVRQEPALLTTLVGNKGGGKNTFMAAVVDEIVHTNPGEYILSNTKITGTIYVPDILKWLGMKLIRQDETWCEVLIDEAAIAGLESRGSYKEARALDSYLFTLSRKVNANIFLSSQLLSMIEKRSQWISDFYVLCESQYEDRSNEPDDMPFKNLQLPSYFEYTVYDNTLTQCNTLEIDGRDAWDLFRMFRTQEIPFQERLERDFIAYYGISERDLEIYDEVMHIEPKAKREVPEIIYEEVNFGNRSLSIDSKVMYAPDPNKLADERLYIVRDKYYRESTHSYWYKLQEIA